MNECMFYYSKGHCKILKIQACEHCKFRKTEQQYADAQKHADEILASKGLCRLMTYDRYGEKIVSVKEIR